MFSPDRFPRIQNSAIATGCWHGPLVTASGTIHTKGTFVSLIASTSFDAFLCGVLITDVTVAGSDTAMLVDIGVDPAGGTTYTVEIPNILGGGCNLSSSTAGAVGGRYVWFPCFIPKGSQVAARNQALISADTARVGIVLIGGKNRSNPFPHRSQIQDYGTDTATSGGTVMANAVLDTKAAWTQLGADTTRRHAGLIVCVAIADGTTINGRHLLDIGMDPAGGTAYGVVIPDVFVGFGESEANSYFEPSTAQLQIDIPIGASIAARSATSSNNLNADLEVAVYGF